MRAILLGLIMASSQDTTARWDALERIMDSAIAQRAFPGGVVAVGRRDSVLYLRAFGKLTYGANGAGGANGANDVTTRTVYDLASLTKVVGLTTAVMMLAEDGRVDLDAPVRGYVQMFGYAHDSTVRVRHLLTHSSGLPAWRPLYQTARDRDEVMDRAALEPQEAPAGMRMVYSDLGAINLTKLVEVLSGERLDRFLSRRLFEPLGMRDTRFVPPASWLERIAPTELDTTWRRRLVRGTVHDENAEAMGGVSGHAGLFSTAEDLTRFAQMMLGGGSYAGTGFLRPGTVRDFTRVQDPALSHRALGWETPNGQNSAGARLTPSAFGHTGFTGTSIWIDPGQDLFIILLTNRVHPTRENPRIIAVRRALADAAADAAARGLR